jgi:hypothetical protein
VAAGVGRNDEIGSPHAASVLKPQESHWGQALS